MDTTIYSSSLTCNKLACWTTAAVLIQILGVSFFVIGFFPVKPTLPGFSGPESYIMPACEVVSNMEEEDQPSEKQRSLYMELSKVSPVYDRLILMVIDGLPAEFVLGRGDKPPTKSMMEAMPYTQSLLSSGKAKAYHAKAAPPTVTMPRLKAMVSGAIGGFLDVAFNFNTQALLDDNLLDQFKRIGWNLVMLGDETWIKLFPRLFSRQDAVSSFFVKDTVEVDLNVSRHLGVELAAEDWNLLILHYLGLDHVGHIGGRHSILMAPKLKEMDDVIKMIHMRTILHHNPSARTLLLVVSDHGMTNSGNHGGSSYEETDSLALFIGYGLDDPENSLEPCESVSQVDITPTLALLFGVPIPNNNIGVLLSGMLDTLTDEQRLRALQLNAWQLLRLLQAHSPGLLCGNLRCTSGDMGLTTNQTIASKVENLCYLFSRATSAHNVWLLNQASHLTSKSTDDLSFAIHSYYDFLGNASEWLSHRATSKPINLLLSGIAIMIISCFLLLSILFMLLKACVTQGKYCFPPKRLSPGWHVDEAFILIGIFIHVLSLGASSMVEEEQYTLYFMTSTLYLIHLLAAIKSLLNIPASDLMKKNKHEKDHTLHGSILDDEKSHITNDESSNLRKLLKNHEVLFVLIILIFGRILRGWHQGGVNWVHLPDISKLLVQAGIFSIKSLQIISLIGFMVLGAFAFYLIRQRKYIVHIICVTYFVSGFLVLLHIIGSLSLAMEPLYSSDTSVAQIFFICSGSVVLLTVLVSPWIIMVDLDVNSIASNSVKSSSQTKGTQSFGFLRGTRDCTYMIGTTFTLFWCLLQLILQQPVNAIPVLMICMQEIASILYFSSHRSSRRQWVEVASMYFLGMSGHFGLGNSNSLATIDVAGAFIGISKHSTVLSGILMFMNTYAAPILSFLSILIYISVKDMNGLNPNDPEWAYSLRWMIGFPCLLPLVLNSIVLVPFTIILMLMRNHLFVWSVFSPKYLYVCASTVCVYIGVLIIAATVVYICSVLSVREKFSKSFSILGKKDH